MDLGAGPWPCAAGAPGDGEVVSVSGKAVVTGEPSGERERAWWVLYRRGPAREMERILLVWVVVNTVREAASCGFVDGG